MSLPPKTKKLTLTLTTTILTHIWKTINKLQFDVTIIPATNVIVNIKNELKNILTINRLNNSYLHLVTDLRYVLAQADAHPVTWLNPAS